ncbi:MAG: hypothetical protein HZY76_17625 [Anaerolineae bacterium]|nr:MAG: hypothetical protein HZY76_17625 [Anaerolineae bacterium]
MPQPQQVLSLTATAERAYLGVSPVRLNLSAWAGGQMRFARAGPDQPQRVQAAGGPGRLRSHTARAASPSTWAPRPVVGRVCCTRACAPSRSTRPARPAPGGRPRNPARARTQKFNPGIQRFALITNDMRMDASRPRSS